MKKERKREEGRKEKNKERGRKEGKKNCCNVFVLKCREIKVKACRGA